VQIIIEIEQAILGRLLIEPDVCDYAWEKLSPDCFDNESHQIIFKEVKSCWDTSVNIDSTIIANRLETKGDLLKVGDREYLLSLVDQAVMPSIIQYYVDQIIEAKNLRELNLLFQTGINLIKEKEESKEVVALVESKLSQISHSRGGYLISSLENLTVEELLASKEKFSTGFLDWDRLFEGLPHNEMWVIAGRPGSGKTAIALNLAINLVKQSIPVGFISIEMGLASLKKRIVCSEADIKSKELKHNRHLNLLNATCQKLRDLPIQFDVSPDISISGIKARISRIVRKYGAVVIFVDYLQLISGPKTDTREREISAISGTLARISKDLEILVIPLCQLNRKLEDRTDKKPVLSDLRESGAIEQDADGVVLLNRPILYGITTFKDENGKEVDSKNIVEVIIAKNRNGETGKFRLRFEAEKTRFMNYQSENYSVT